MTASKVIPIEFRRPLNTFITDRKGGTKHIIEHNPTLLSLEVVKSIWRKYPTLSDTKKAAAAVPTWPSLQDSNALELSLGAQTVNEAFGGSLSLTMPNTESGRQHTGRTDEDLVAPAAASSRIGSPTSERAVDELLPIACDSMDTSPATRINFLSCDPSQLSSSQDQTGEDRSHISHSLSASTSAKSQDNTRIHSMDDVRSELLGTMLKMTQLRNPNKDVDEENFSERFARTTSDTEVRDFLRKGKEAIDQLKSSGKLEEIKRKYLNLDDGDEQRRTRRRLDGRTPQSVDTPHTSMQNNAQGQHSTSDPGYSRGSTLVRSTRQRDPPTAPKAMLANNWKESHDNPSLGQLPTFPQQHDLESLSPGQIPEDKSMSISGASQLASLSPHATPTPSIMSPTGHATNNRLVSVGANYLPYTSDTNCDGLFEDVPPPDPSLARILLAKIGLSAAGLLNASFDLDDKLVAAIRRWAERSTHFDPNELSMRLYLIGIPTSAAEKVYQERPPNAPPSFLAESVCRLSPAWPQPGTLYVSFNAGRPEAISWPEHFFGPSSPALDLSSAVVQGTNNIQFVQLEDHSQTLFVVLTIPPNQVEQQEASTLHSCRKSWIHLSQDYRNKSHVKLWLDASRHG